jgi:hypothetical protein
MFCIKKHLGTVLGAALMYLNIFSRNYRILIKINSDIECITNCFSWIQALMLMRVIGDD